MTPDFKANVILATVFMLMATAFLVCAYWILERGEVTLYTPVEMVYVRLPTIAGAITKIGPFVQGYRVMDLPDFLPPGDYEWRVHVSFTLNALRTGEIEVAPPIKFKVIE